VNLSGKRTGHRKFGRHIAGYAECDVLLFGELIKKYQLFIFLCVVSKEQQERRM